MENATKALLIAGSLLIAILLIAMGMRIFNSTKGTVDSTQTVMDATSKAIVMNQFTSYVGDNVSTAKVCEFLNKVAAYNATVSVDSQKIIIECWSSNCFYVAGVDVNNIYKKIPIIKEKDPNSSWHIVNQTNQKKNTMDFTGYILGFEIYSTNQ